MKNPKVIQLLKDAGISLRAIGQLRRLNVPGFLGTMEKILKDRPDLRVEFGDPYEEIKNQYAELNTGTMSDASPAIKEDKSFAEEYPLLTGAGAVAGTTGALAATKLTKPTSEFLKNQDVLLKKLQKCL